MPANAAGRKDTKTERERDERGAETIREMYAQAFLSRSEEKKVHGDIAFGCCPSLLCVSEPACSAGVRLKTHNVHMRESVQCSSLPWKRMCTHLGVQPPGF